VVAVAMSRGKVEVLNACSQGNFYWRKEYEVDLGELLYGRTSP
jgi:hypothetical protein